MRCRALAVLIAVALAAGCTVTDDFVQDIGTTRIAFVDSDLASQNPDDPHSRIQAVKWEIAEACLDLDGDLVDLKNLQAGCSGEQPQACAIADSNVTSPSAGDDDCAKGMVVGASPDEPQSIRLTAKFTMKVWTAEPKEYLLDDDDDRDDDGVYNWDDNCPWTKNDQQEDENLDGIGDRCQLLTSTGVYVPDTDGDGVRDSADNCVWEYNPDQKNKTDSTERGIDDGIGDECDVRSAEVVDSTGATDIQIELGPVDLFQARNRPSYITIDFTNALDCDWTVGTCTLTRSLLRFCAASSAGAGCP